MTAFYARVLLATTGGTKKEAASSHKRIGTKWRKTPGVTDLEFDDEPYDANNDVEGFGEWTTSYELRIDTADEAAARALVEALLTAEEHWDITTELQKLVVDD
jgi:hypothetical protein